MKENGHKIAFGIVALWGISIYTGQSVMEVGAGATIVAIAVTGYFITSRLCEILEELKKK